MIGVKKRLYIYAYGCILMRLHIDAYACVISLILMRMLVLLFYFKTFYVLSLNVGSSTLKCSFKKYV
jgi:hypothetical protein